MTSQGLLLNFGPLLRLYEGRPPVTFLQTHGGNFITNQIPKKFEHCVICKQTIFDDIGFQNVPESM